MGLVGAGLGIGSVGTGNGGCSGGTGTSGGMLGGVSSVLILVLDAPIKDRYRRKRWLYFQDSMGYSQRPTPQTPSRASNLARDDRIPLVEHQDRARAKRTRDGL